MVEQQEVGGHECDDDEQVRCCCSLDQCLNESVVPYSSESVGLLSRSNSETRSGSPKSSFKSTRKNHLMSIDDNNQ